jgi:hypothetical protein
MLCIFIYIFLFLFTRNTLRGQGVFYRDMMTHENDYALIFISPGILPALRNVREINIDATFRIVPVVFYQLITFHALAYSHVSQCVISSGLLNYKLVLMFLLILIKL